MTGSLQKLATIASQAWRDRAACAWTDPRLFDPPDRHGDDAQRLHDALSLCRACPVRDDCLEDGIVNHESGVRGGELLDYGTPRKGTDDNPLPALPRNFIDEIAVERIMAGTLRIPMSYRGPELREAIRRLAEVGLSDEVIGLRVGRTAATVCKVRSRLHIVNGATHAHVSEGGFGLLHKPSRRARARKAS